MSKKEESFDYFLVGVFILIGCIQLLGGACVVFIGLASIKELGWSLAVWGGGILVTSLIWFALARIIDLLNELRKVNDQSPKPGDQERSEGGEPNVYEL